MKRKYSVPLGTLLLLSITYICTSYVPLPSESTENQLESGRYDLVAKASESIELLGNVSFQSIRNVSVNGEESQKLQLSFHSDEGKDMHNITVYFTGLDSTSPLNKGTYYITKNISGFLNDFNGVFGFADIHLLGELPYFARKGKIRITAIDENNVKGRLDLELKNNTGHIVEVSGDFVASNVSGTK